MKDCIGYIRISKSKENGLSLKAQQQSIRAYAKARGYHLVETIKDDGLSAGSLNRAGIERVLGYTDCVLVISKLDRLCRNLRDLLHLLDNFQDRNIELVSITESLDLTSALGRLLVQIIGSLAEFERSQTSERNKQTADYLRSNNLKNGSVPFGWDCRGRKLVENVREMKVLQRMKTLRRQGKSYPQICSYLNERGIKSKLKKTFHPFTIQKILRRNLP